MSEVFLSYRQTDDEHKQRVRAFGQRLRNCGIDVVLDQFFLDDNPGGPNEGWDKWSSDRALHTEYVLILGTEEWFQCFEKTQPPGTGLGAACEADDLRHRIYEAGGIIKNIRIVLFDEADGVHIPGKLKRYHRFHAERDFENIVRWFKDPIPIITGDTPRTSIPHNLPSLQPFFGREEELRKIAEALDPELRTWGALIDGPGGMGKTSLAIRAAYDASPKDFEKIVYVSLKSRELDDDGVRDLSGFLISGLAELLNELARELRQAHIARAPEEQRPRLLLEALRDTRTLLVLDNLESLVRTERDILFTFVARLPPGCKAILTGRGRIGSGGQELILQKLGEEAALATLAKLAESNPTLALTTEAERLLLYHETRGTPLLLRWTAGQIGRGSCLTLSDAIAYLRSSPAGNDPLEFILGDLVKNLDAHEINVLCAFTYFTLPAKAEHIAEIAGCPQADGDRALRSLINRSLVIPIEEQKTFTLVPLVIDFLRKERPEVVAEIGNRLEEFVFALVVENGYEQKDRFPDLDAAWPAVAAALPRFLIGPNELLQTVCNALAEFLNFSGRWDELLALSRDAESRAVAERNFLEAGWRAYQAGWIRYLRGQSAELLAAVNNAESHWHKAQAGIRERAIAIHLRGEAHKLANDNSAAIAALREAVELLRTFDSENGDVATALNSLADVERLSGDLSAAECDYREAMRIFGMVGNNEGIAIVIGNLAALSLDHENWLDAEALAREALSLSVEIRRQDLIASHCRRLAIALVRQGKKAEALPHAERAVDILTRLRSRDLAAARKILGECLN
jgi:tetratricopeptide (TPR) repeat protein